MLLEDDQTPKDSASDGMSSLSPEKLKKIEEEFSSSRKVLKFLSENPMRMTFIKKQRGKLPYSVFRPHANNIYFLKSIFEKRPPTAFFPYPRYCKAEREPGERLRTYDINEVE